MNRNTGHKSDADDYFSSLCQVHHTPWIATAPAKVSPSLSDHTQLGLRPAPTNSFGNMHDKDL